MKLLPVGQPLELMVPGLEAYEPLPGVVQESPVVDECVLSLRPPACPLGYVLPGTMVRLRFANPLGLHGATATILDMRPGPPMELNLGEFRDETTVQRREYYRVTRGLPATVTVRVSHSVEPGLVDSGAFTYDISGGGIRLDTFLAVGIDDRLWVAVRVPERLQAAHSAALQARAEVLRIEPVVRGGEDLSRVAARFHFRREIDRDAWVHLVLDLQKHIDEE